MTAAKTPAQTIAVYANGLFQDGYPSPTIPYATQAQQLAQGMTTIILWSIHINSSGDLILNGSPFVSKGQIQYSKDPTKGVNPDFPQLMQTLTGSGSTVTQVLISVGAWSTAGDFDNWYGAQAAVARNIQALVSAFGIVGVDFDFEPETGPNAYNQKQQDMIVALTEQVAKLGLFVTYCPYIMQNFWNGCLNAVYAKLGTQPVKWWNLQCYAGGAVNNPTQWAQSLPSAASSGVTNPSAYIVPGFAAGKGGQDPSSIQQTFVQYAGTGITGGFLWNSGTLFNGESGGTPTPRDYANAISSGLQTP